MRGYWNRSSKKRSKYGNVKVVYDGIKFDSIGECDCYKFYKLQEKAGYLYVQGTQPKVYLTAAKILYKPDLVYEDVGSGELVYVDYKGKRTASFQIKKRLWKHYGPSRLILCNGYGLDIKVIEVIIPKGK